jgi:hypothetical protein
VSATQTTVLEPGGFAFCPRNCTHAFRNQQAADDTLFLTLNSPAGHERAMASIRQLIRAGAPQEQVNRVAVQGGFILHERPQAVNERT